ncbi:MAG: hypothetical protein F8N15_08450 [Methanobacterium sp.]|nr:hypothetical protein [Methanobacterium sp.]
MRVSEGVTRGKMAELANPEIFRDREEVIVFTRDEFNRIYRSMMTEIDHINRIHLYLDEYESWKLMGYWPKIMERVYILDRNMDALLRKEPLQCYLDAFLESSVETFSREVVASKGKLSVKDMLPI